jgi:hypothetical protein
MPHKKQTISEEKEEVISMRAANENRQMKLVGEKRERHLALVKVWVPRDKVVEIKSMAVGLLKESFCQTRPQEKTLKVRMGRYKESTLKFARGVMDAIRWN